MKVIDKERFLFAMYELYKSVDHISCAGDLEYEGEKSAGAEDFIQAYKMWQLAQGDTPTEAQVTYTEEWIRGWITNGPVFIIFNEPGLLKEVNEYIEAQDQSCSCGDVDGAACSRCSKE